MCLKESIVMQSSRKRIKLLIIFSMVTLVTALALTTGASPGQRTTEIAGFTTPMSERLGADDKPSLVIHFTGEVHGTLEPCG
jgi:hypothetical protein